MTNLGYLDTPTEPQVKIRRPRHGMLLAVIVCDSVFRRIKLKYFLVIFLGMSSLAWSKSRNLQNYVFSYCNEANVCFEVKSPNARILKAKGSYYFAEARLKIYKGNTIKTNIRVKNLRLNSRDKVLYKKGGRHLDMNQTTL